MPPALSCQGRIRLLPRGQMHAAPHRSEPCTAAIVPEGSTRAAVIMSHCLVLAPAHAAAALPGTGHRSQVCARPAAHSPRGSALRCRWPSPARSHGDPELAAGRNGLPGPAVHPVPQGGPSGCSCRTPGQRLPAESRSARAPVPRGWPGPGSPSSPAAALNQMGPAVSAGHVGLTHTANFLTLNTLRPRDAPTFPDPLPAPGSLPGWPRGSREPLLGASHREGSRCCGAGSAVGLDPAPLPLPCRSTSPGYRWMGRHLPCPRGLSWPLAQHLPRLSCSSAEGGMPTPPRASSREGSCTPAPG